MKKITLLLLLLVASFVGRAQSTIFEDSFESYTTFAITNVGNWTLTDVDGGSTYVIGTTTFLNSGVAKSFMVFNPALTAPALTPSTTSNWTPKTGSQLMVCFNKSNPAPLVNDDWLISPQITLGTTNTVKFWAKSGSAVVASAGPPPTPSEFSEKFDVWVSSTNTSIASFVKISGATVITTIAPGATWREYTFSIPTLYNSTPVYIGIHCVSEDQFGLCVDDFKVTGTVPCPPPTAGLSSVNTGFLFADLSWTSGGAANAQIVYQLQGAGVPSNAPATGTSVSGTTYSTPTLLANTNYEFYVRDVCTAGTVYSTWSGPYLFNTTATPDCVTLVSPVNAATAINYTTPIALTWTAAATGGPSSSYDVFTGTTANPTTLAGNSTTLSFNIPFGLATTTYYWKVIAKNAAGNAVGCTAVFSFTTAGNLYTPYCGPVTYSAGFEPITLVNFAGINKTYPNEIAAVANASLHKVFTDVSTVSQGSTNPISLNGMTDGAYKNYYTVFIDWNQNGILNDAGEIYFGTAPLSITSSTGLPGTTPVVGSIVVPTTATLGSTRLRIKKNYGGATTVPPDQINPCTSTTAGTQYGEVHDYVVNVTPNLVTDTFTSINFKSYPNPVKDVLNLSYDKNITNVSILNLLGQEVLSIKNDNQEVKIDMSGLTAGAYMVKISSDNEVKTIKVIKE